jgi:hypothetical protein
MKYDLVLHIIWIAGIRMIKQGTDGLSRGEEMGPVTQGLSLMGVFLHPPPIRCFGENPSSVGMDS